MGENPQGSKTKCWIEKKVVEKSVKSNAVSYISKFNSLDGKIPDDFRSELNREYLMNRPFFFFIFVYAINCRISSGDIRVKWFQGWIYFCLVNAAFSLSLSSHRFGWWSAKSQWERKCDLMILYNGSDQCQTRHP